MRFSSWVLLVAIASVVLSYPAQALPVAAEFEARGQLQQPLIQRMHFWHCKRDFGWSRHWHGRRQHAHRRWHRHRGPCLPLGEYYTPYFRPSDKAPDHYSPRRGFPRF